MSVLKTFRLGVVYCFSPFFKCPRKESEFRPAEIRVGLALSPLRGLVGAALVLTPFLFLITTVKNLDPIYTQMLFPLLFCVILERMVHLRRISAFCRCVEAINQPEHAAQIMQTKGEVPMTPTCMFTSFFILAAKLMVLYMLVAKFLVTGMKTDDELLIDFALVIIAIPMFAETGAVLLFSGDEAGGGKAPLKGLRALLPLLTALLLTLPVAVLIWVRISQNTVILSAALVMFMVFLWKHQADRHIGKINVPVAWACYECGELAAMIGILIV